MAAFMPLALLSLVTSVTLSNAVMGGGCSKKRNEEITSAD